MNTHQQEVQTIRTALQQLGSSEQQLSMEEKRSIDENGYVLFPNLIQSEWLVQLRSKYEELMEKEGQNAGGEFGREEGTRRLSDLVNKGEVFDGMYTHPKVLAAVYYILKNEFKLAILNGRDALPGQGHQALHVDDSKEELVVNTFWLLDDFSPENGATRLVPGSHKWEKYPDELMDNPLDPHPDEVIITAPAGSVMIFNGHIWHGGTKNRTERTRRAISAYYGTRGYQGQIPLQKEVIRKSVYDRISPAARYLLDV